MKITELSKICNISRMTVYRHINEGMTKEEILKKYTTMPITTKNEYLLITDLKEIKKIVVKMVVEYQNSLSREINFSDVNSIYEIVKKY